MTAFLELAHTQNYPDHALYIVAMPIGNAADITLRALYILGLVDRIAAEDTRNTGRLLARYGISKPLFSIHKYNERGAGLRLIEYLRSGERIAYVSDAGTPGISDPGAQLINLVRISGYEAIPIPGPSAVTTALSVVGTWVGTSFTFIGFLPSKSGKRISILVALKTHPYTLVFYEAPHRIVKTINSLADTLGETRRLLIARELTKLHEQCFHGTLIEGITWLESDKNRQRGEFVFVVEGANIHKNRNTHKLYKNFNSELP
ncbi:MAG: 16S rRNA (cytidine(1402)-2'-O)-methyltransferase [Burkholderia sp.]|nr:16S rRNA (cytidine(1402)-2'-O)-methyltransferase [Burkholderia sp.]